MEHRIVLPIYGTNSYWDVTETMTLRDWLRTVEDDQLRTVLLAIYDAYADIFAKAKGSTAIHQAWKGGLKDHLAEVFRHERDAYESWWQRRRRRSGTAFVFTWDESVVAVFCHDAEKLLSHGPKGDPRVAPYRRAHMVDDCPWDDLKWELLGQWQREYGLVLTPAVENAIKYTHGEGKDYRKDRPVMGPLAALVGNADRASARGFPDEGRGRG